MVVSSRSTGPRQIHPQSHTNFLDVFSMDPQKNTKYHLEIMLWIPLALI